MRGITNCQKGVPGAVPGASTYLREENHSGKSGTTEQCSVEIAKVLPVAGDGQPTEASEKAVANPTLADEVRANLKRTFGKGGVRELSAVPAEAGPYSPIRRNVYDSQCDGCNSGAPGWRCSGYLCPMCVSERKRNLARSAKVAPADVISDALEAAWQALAEDAGLDPVTVATCKRLRDLELGMLGGKGGR